MGERPPCRAELRSRYDCRKMVAAEVHADPGPQVSGPQSPQEIQNPARDSEEM